MSDSEGEVLVAEEATPESLTDQISSDIPNQPHSSTTQSCQSSQEHSALSGERTDSQGSAATAGADVTSVSRRAEINQQGTTRVSGRTVTSIHESRGEHTLAQGAGASSHHSSAANTTPCTSTPTTNRAENSTAPTAGSASSAGRGPHSTSTPLGVSQRYPSQFTRNYTGNQNREYSEQEEEEEDCDWEQVERMGNVAGSILGYSPLVFENNEEEGDDHLDELYVPISGYEVMEQRSKFTVFKLHVQKSATDGYFIFRRYTDFTRLNMKLKMLYPCFRLALPPKRWFSNNFDPIFLEDRLLGLQAFLNNVTGHKDIRKSAPVKEFLCLNDPPGPHDSLEESRVMVESLEEVAYNLRRDCAERDRLLRKKNEEIARLKARIQELENAGLPLETLENERVGTDQESESSTVEGDRRSCVEADLMDHGIPDANDEGISESMDSSLKVKIENLGKEPVKCGDMVGEGDKVAIAITQSVTPVGGDSR
eukprot:XP_011674248.1 PREDICTED: sorting nexin-16 [Strongylocentrotus purpuratus]